MTDAKNVTVQTLSHDGIQRRYRVYRPSQPKDRPGLVFILHGAVGSGEQISELTLFDKQAERLGWIAVYPDAHQPGPYGGWSTFATPHPVDDVGFIATLIEQLKRIDNANPAMVYAAGFSRGGMFAYRLGCELADQIGAIASVSGNMADWAGDAEGVSCRPKRPVSLLVIHGTSDRNVPIEGGVSPDYPDQVAYAALSDVLRVWRRFMGCESVIGTVRRSGSATVRRWDCPGGDCIELWLVEGGLHAWPGPANPPYSPDAKIDASEVIANFFNACSQKTVVGQASPNA